MRCPHCAFADTKVIDSRDADDGIRRRRECLSCGERFTTFERVQTMGLLVVKKDGRREDFSREKVLAGIRKACEKRPLPVGAIEAVVDDIEATLQAQGKGEVLSSLIGELVMDHLRDLDHIAYIRFASVYRAFADIESLREELEALAAPGAPPAGQLPLLPEQELVGLGRAPRPMRRRPGRPRTIPRPLTSPVEDAEAAEARRRAGRRP